VTAPVAGRYQGPSADQPTPRMGEPSVTGPTYNGGAVAGMQGHRDADSAPPARETAWT